MINLPEMPLDWVMTVRIPGLPPGGRLVTADAEEKGVKMPTYSAGEISKIFFNRFNDRFVSRKLVSAINPEIGHDSYFTPLWSTEHDDYQKLGPSGQRWSLGEVERMIIHLYTQYEITYTQYTIARQIVAWTARGFGIYSG